MARRVFTRSSSRSRRPNIWGGINTSAPVALAAATTHSVVVVSNADIKARTAPTLARTRGKVFTTAAAGVSANGSMGILVVEETARAAGVASMPNPFIDHEAPWLWWNPLFAASHTPD